MAPTTVPIRACDWALDDGALRALADGEAWGVEAPGRTAADLEGHVRTCEPCRDRSQALRRTAAVAQGRLARLVAPPSLVIAPPALASITQARPVPWHVRVQDAMPSPDRRHAWLTRVGAAAAALVLVASWPAVSSFADGALQSFRVQRVQPIVVDLKAVESRFGSTSVSDARIREALRFRGLDEPKLTVTSQADAASRAGMALRLPKSVPAAVGSKPARFAVTTGFSVDMTVDGPKLVQVARDAKVTDAALLGRIGALDGASVRVEATPAVLAVWGEVDFLTQGSTAKPASSGPVTGARGPMFMLGQMKSPVVSVPGSVDVEGLRDALIKSGALPPELVHALASVKDWRSTLPLPTGGADGLRPVDVDGSAGSIASRTRDGKPMTTVMWVRDGVLYLGIGELPEADVLAAARSLAPARS